MSPPTYVRLIAADPTSTALLLASPAAIELWPQAVVTRGGRGPAEVLLHVPGRGWVATQVRAAPPLRTPTLFRIRFTVTAASPHDWPTTPATRDDAWEVEGRLDLVYAEGKTCAQLEITGWPLGELDEAAEMFLRRLAQRAERRADAA